MLIVMNPRPFMVWLQAGCDAQHAPQQPAQSRKPDISNEPEPDISKKL
jgi:hypothetical protein